MEVFQPFLDKTKSYLDFGGGDGHFAALLCSHGFRVATYELSGGRSDIAKQRLSAYGANYLGSVSPDTEMRFDGIFLIEVAEHVLDEDVEPTYRLIRSLLKPGGLLFLTTPNNEDLDLGSAYEPQSGLFFHRWQHVRSFDRAKLTAMLKPFGLHEVLIHQIDFRPESFGAMNEAIAERRLKIPFATMRPITMTPGPNLVGLFCTEQGRIKVGETPYHISTSTVARLPTDASAIAKSPFARIWDFAARFPRLHKIWKSPKQVPVSATDTRANALLSGLARLDFSSMNTDQRYSVLEQLIAVLVPGTHLSEIERSMFCDYEFRQFYEKFSVENYRSYDRKFAMREFARLAMNCEGAFAECGVFKGASAYTLAKELQRREPDRRLHLYDSFQGLSSPGSLDGTHWTKGDLSGRLDEVQSNLKDVAAQIVYHQGWIPDCFDENSEQMFSFVHIDVDLHQPTLDALQYFYPRMSPHGIILSDDYGFETCPGARKAFDDFFRDKKEMVMHLPTGQGVVICNI